MRKICPFSTLVVNRLSSSTNINLHVHIDFQLRVRASVQHVPPVLCEEALACIVHAYSVVSWISVRKPQGTAYQMY